VRLALLGQIGPHRQVIQSIGEFCTETLQVPRVVYLGADDAFDTAIADWAGRIAGQPGVQSLWTRSLECLQASAEVIEHFLEAEQRLVSLKRFETLCAVPGGYTIVHVGTYPLLLCHQLESISLDGELPLVVVQGANAEPTICAESPPASSDAGRFACIQLAPGSMEHGGLLVLEATQDGLRADWYDRRCQKLATRDVSLAEALARSATAG